MLKFSMNLPSLEVKTRPPGAPADLFDVGVEYRGGKHNISKLKGRYKVAYVKLKQGLSACAVTDLINIALGTHVSRLVEVRKEEVAAFMSGERSDIGIWPKKK